MLKDEDVPPSVIEAVYAQGQNDDVISIVKRARSLATYLKSESGEALMAAYKRATNMVMAEEQKDQKKYRRKPKRELLISEEERALFQAYIDVQPALERAVKSEDYDQVMGVCSSLKNAVDKFFDNVTVNCDNAARRKNRLYLLAQFKTMLHKVADFSVIQT